MAGLRARAGRVSGPCSGGFCELQPVSGERMEGEGRGHSPLQGQGQGHGRACTALPAESSHGARCAHAMPTATATTLGPRKQTNRGAVCTANTAARPQTAAAPARAGCAGARWTRQDPAPGAAGAQPGNTTAESRFGKVRMGVWVPEVAGTEAEDPRVSRLRYQ